MSIAIRCVKKGGIVRIRPGDRLILTHVDGSGWYDADVVLVKRINSELCRVRIIDIICRGPDAKIFLGEEIEVLWENLQLNVL